MSKSDIMRRIMGHTIHSVEGLVLRNIFTRLPDYLWIFLPLCFFYGNRDLPSNKKRHADIPFGCTCKIKVDTHKSVGVYFFRRVMYNEIRKDVKQWARKVHRIGNLAKKRR